jgi:hypothetical protein
MQYAGLYNFGGGGTETVTGGSNENIPSFEENVCNNDKMLFSGQFSNLSRVLIHVTLRSFGTAQAMHKHDLRPYESLNVTNIPLSAIAIHVPSGETVGFHGMGVLFQTEDEDEFAVSLSKANLQEDLHNSPDFDTDDYKNVQITTATTTDLWLPTTDTDIQVYKITISVSGANIVDLIWTDDVNGNVKTIGKIRMTGEGSFVYDFDPAGLRNPNRQNGKLRAITTTTATTDIQVIGHEVEEGQ